MEILIAWRVTLLECYPEKNGYNNVVCKVHVECSAHSSPYLLTESMICDIQFLENSFTEFENLTHEQVLNWVWESNIDKESVEATLKNKINNQLNNPITVKTTPWIV
jgi:hypothetical protein